MSPEKMTAYLEKQERAKRKRELMRLYANNPERRREHRKESRRLWKETNPEEYEAYKEKVKLQNARYYAAHREERRQWRRDNKEMQSA